MSRSHPKFAEWDFLLARRAALKNPAVHFDLKDVPPEFLLKELDDLELAIEMFFIINSTGTK